MNTIPVRSGVRLLRIYPAVVIYCNTGLRNAELRRARWHQVDFTQAEFQVGKAKTKGGKGRIVPLNKPAM